MLRLLSFSVVGLFSSFIPVPAAAASLATPTAATVAQTIVQTLAKGAIGAAGGGILYRGVDSFWDKRLTSNEAVMKHMYNPPSIAKDARNGMIMAAAGILVNKAIQTWNNRPRGTSEATDNFVGKLKGNDVELPNVKKQNISYTKRNPVETKKLRNSFNNSTKGEFLQDFAQKHTDQLKEMGFTDVDIAKMKNGKVPNGYNVHHKLPLDDGGTNDLDNLILTKNDPYHKSITNYQNSLATKIEPGTTFNIDWPIPEGDFYVG